MKILYRKNRLLTALLMSFISSLAMANSDYQKALEKELSLFVNETKEISHKTTFTPRYMIKYYERIKIIDQYRKLSPHLYQYDGEIKNIKKYLRRSKNKQALEAIHKHVLKYNTSIQLMNYLMMSGDNFIAALSDDFDEINYDSKKFEKLFKSVNRQLRYDQRYYKQRHNQDSVGPFDEYELENLYRPSVYDFEKLQHEILSLAKDDKDKELALNIIDLVEEFQDEARSFKTLKKETQWNAASYNIFYGIKEIILKGLSYIALPMKHAIKEKELKKVAQQEFLPGDIGAIQRYGKLSNIVFKGNWTHGLIYIGEYSKFSKYFASDENTTEVYRQKCQQQQLSCSDFITYLFEKYPKSMNEYRESEQQGRPFVTLEGLKPGVVFMELGPSMAWDNLVVLRPKLTIKDKALALERTFSSIGKKYDYSFNGNSYSRFVCTELIQFSYEENPYEDKKGLDWDVNLVMGRPAMYGFDLVQTFINQVEDPTREQQLSLVLYMKSIRKKDKISSSIRPEFGSAKRGTIQELKETL